MRRSLALALVVFATAVPACEAAAPTATVDEVTPTSIKYVGFKCNTTYRAVFRVVNANGTTSAGETINQKTKACVDTTPPTASFTNPLDGQTVRGTVNVTADASDAGGVWFTAFRVDSTTADPTLDYSSPYGFALDTTTLADGPHTLYVRAEDNAQNIGPDATVTFTVDNTSPPPPPGSDPAPIAGQGYHQVFGDDFSTLDRSVWDDHIWYDGRPNPAWTGFQEADSTGVLHLRTKRSWLGSTGVPYPLNTITTQTSGRTFQYGYFETRMKWPAGHGSWPGFWLYSYQHATDQSQCTTQAGEIDVMEGQGSEPSNWYGTVHSNTNGCAPNDNQNDNNYQDAPADLTADFHTYGVKWTPTTITWYLDGVETHSAPAYPTDNQPMFLLLQEWTGGWTFDPDATTPETLDNQIDYVKVYQQ